MRKCEIQRACDFVFSLIAIIILAPILLPVVLALKLTGEGEIFYRQKRVGLSGVDFELLKFATMLKNSPNIGAGNITVKNDPRVLPLGRFLRASKINELPQLINVLRGEMSIIGPRPLTCDNFAVYPKNAQLLISSVRPGLSGIGSIIFRAEEDMMHTGEDVRWIYENKIAPYKAELEIWYIENQSLVLYLKAIFVTIVVVLNKGSQLPWRAFDALPKPPHDLRF